MDGLSALSVAASVVQFIEFGCTLVSKSKEIYKSANGASIQQVETELATRRLVELSERIKISAGLAGGTSEPRSSEDQALQVVCNGCITVSNELFLKLERLKVHEQGKFRKYKSFRQALKSVWSKGAIDDVVKRLKAFREEMDAHVLLSLSSKFNSLTLLQDEKFAALDTKLQRAIEPMLRYLVRIHNTVEEVATVQYGKHRLSALRDGQGLIPSVRPVNSMNHGDLEQSVMDEEIKYAILRSLRFSEMSHRKSEIAEAHKRTCSWIFRDVPGNKPPNGAQLYDDFVLWLREGTGIYWINGKAGSGKSTLMRFICENSMSRTHLNSWSQGQVILIANFYFWNSGTELQRSQKGLFRSLLFDVLNNRRDLIPNVFPAAWAEAIDFVTSARGRSGETFSFEFSIVQLQAAFYNLMCLATSHLKLCFFIDGLDEYDGDLEMLVKLLKKGSKSPFVKFCVSSRPWLVFDEAFDNCPNLRLQDLTYDDIRIYVHEKLQSNEKMKSLERKNQTSAASLINAVVSKANGVFLWVRVVTQSLINGLRNRDDILDLQRRLDALPSDLDTLYSHMLNRIDPLYIDQASRIFQIYDLASELNLQPTILELELAVTATYSVALSEISEFMTDSEIGERCDRMGAHLKSRCEGLLELHNNLDINWEPIAHADLEELAAAGSCELIIAKEDPISKRLRAFWKVSYMHRTVKDFLKTESVRVKLQKRSPLTNEFDPRLSLLMSYVINLKRRVYSYHFTSERRDHERRYASIASMICRWDDNRVRKTVRDAVAIASHLQDKTLESNNLLNKFQKAAHNWWNSATKEIVCTSLSQEEWQAEIVIPTVYSGLWNFVDVHFFQNQSGPRFLSPTTLLQYALGLDAGEIVPQKTRDLYQPTPEMVDLLLRHGADPNAPVPVRLGVGITLWGAFVSMVSFADQNFTKQEDYWTKCSQILRLMLDKDVLVKPCVTALNELWDPFSIEFIAYDLMPRKAPTEAIELQNALAKRRKRSIGKRKRIDLSDPRPSHRHNKKQRVGRSVLTPRRRS